MLCPECGDEMRIREERFPDCESCGFEQYDEWTLAMIAEIKREQAICKQMFGRVLSYGEAREKGLAK
jgi:NADH pyrophosphatase NudC (nudix superfamily)